MDGDNKSTSAVAQETARLEEQLQGWGEALLATDRVLRWEKPYYPALVVSATTLIFLVIYWLDPSVLTGLSIVVMLVCLADYLIPTLTAKFLSSKQWTTEQQQRFHEICSSLVKARLSVAHWGHQLLALKEEKPKVYFISVTTVLALAAWIGQQVHNLLLTFLIVTFLLLFPGLTQQGIICSYVGMAKREINKLLKRKEKKAE
ncbi:ADP-ribosylation factor-like protein 6-interacting protein 1 [Lethenteron reissneri]|uniref:ADP-ribosylation factor-like protein 6-interacting protein 1 n=1 Tax=Lethenteron reissneri TaxID=7753 RepID=UPI002AB781E3|nr:ADP-ribosylation factor-like protein 6-interacting protein 1 [Lethenteron reissneri]